MQEALELRIRGLFILVAQISSQGKCRALDKFFWPAPPGLDPSLRRACTRVKITASSVHDVPRIKLSRPAFHLRNRDFVRFSDQCCQNSRFVNLRRPQLLGQCMALPNTPRKRMQNRRGNSIRLWHFDAEICHLGANFWICSPLQFAQDPCPAPTLRHTLA